MKLADRPELLNQAAAWFSDKWQISAAAYRESMQTSIQQQKGVPQWYVILDDQQQIIAGAGIIENDFHNREDLAPNLCALFVEETYRKQNIAKQLLDFARADMGRAGVEQLYLVTDLECFYEKCGWTFLTAVQDDDGEPMNMYVAKTL
jgi:N-acetylglutamate synthase-like GNAT family acetyltransferase